MNQIRKMLQSIKAEASKIGMLPYGYTRVNYLANDGNHQTIKMLPVLKDDIVEITALTTNPAVYRTIIGNNIGPYELYFENFRINVYTANILLLSDKVIDEELKLHTVRIRMNLNSSPYLFGYTADGSYPLDGRIYGCKVTRNGRVVQELVPCLDANGNACFFDLISRTTLYNSNKNNKLFLFG